MGSPREDAAFLSGSTNRMLLLESLVDGSMSLSALQKVAGVSRTTLWRVVSEFEQRGWIEETDDGYVATTVGAFVADSYSGLLDDLAVADELGELFQWLPREEIGFDLGRLAGATVAVPTPSDPQAPLRLALEQTAAAETVRILTHAMSPAITEAAYEGVQAGSQTVEAVITQGAIDAMAGDADIMSQFEGLLALDDATVYRYSEDIPHVLAILDGERVGLGIDDDQGRPLAVLDIADDEVLAWAEETYERYRAEAAVLDP